MPFTPPPGGWSVPSDDFASCGEPSREISLGNTTLGAADRYRIHRHHQATSLLEADIQESGDV